MICLIPFGAISNRSAEDNGELERPPKIAIWRPPELPKPAQLGLLMAPAVFRSSR